MIVEPRELNPEEIQDLLAMGLLSRYVQTTNDYGNNIDLFRVVLYFLTGDKEMHKKMTFFDFVRTACQTLSMTLRNKITYLVLEEKQDTDAPEPEKEEPTNVEKEQEGEAVKQELAKKALLFEKLYKADNNTGVEPGGLYEYEEFMGVKPFKK